MANGHAVDKGWKQNQSKKSWMLPTESESEKPLLQLSYAVIVPKVFANSSSDKCSSLLEIINWKVSGWSWKWALLFRTAYKAKYVQSSRPAVPRQAFFFQEIFVKGEVRTEISLVLAIHVFPGTEINTKSICVNLIVNFLWVEKWILVTST